MCDPYCAKLFLNFYHSHLDSSGTWTRHLHERDKYSETLIEKMIEVALPSLQYFWRNPLSNNQFLPGIPLMDTPNMEGWDTM